VPNGDAIVRTHNPAVGQRVVSQGCTATAASSVHLSAANVLRFREGLCVSQHDHCVKNPKAKAYVNRSPLVQRLKLSAVMQCYGIASTFRILK
jgi:hypothetical protein